LAATPRAKPWHLCASPRCGPEHRAALAYLEQVHHSAVGGGDATANELRLMLAHVCRHANRVLDKFGIAALNALKS
jgi:hypothetical protein